VLISSHQSHHWLVLMSYCIDKRTTKRSVFIRTRRELLSSRTRVILACFSSFRALRPSRHHHLALGIHIESPVMPQSCLDVILYRQTSDETNRFLMRTTINTFIKNESYIPPILFISGSKTI
jgi:hypothetical protein